MPKYNDFELDVQTAEMNHTNSIIYTSPSYRCQSFSSELPTCRCTYDCAES